MKRFFRFVFGLMFIFLGIIGLFLPILQGLLFIFIGLLILAPESRMIRTFLKKLENRFPKIFEKAHKIKENLFKRKRP
jgi:uncharacterized protein